jgi:hypothetical protein
MRALAKVLSAAAFAALATISGPAFAEDACDAGDLTRFSAEAMVSDIDLRAGAETALEACAAFALAQFRNVGEVEERILVQVAALAGRTTYASYAADEIPKASPALIALLTAAFRPLYPHLRALSEEENTAIMRTIVFHLIEQASPNVTGSAPRGPVSPGARP